MYCQQPKRNLLKKSSQATRAVPRFQLANIFYFYKSLTCSLPITSDLLHLVIFIGNTFDLTPIHKNFLIASRLKSGTVSLRIGENSKLNQDMLLGITKTIPYYSSFKDRIVTLIQTPFINKIKKLNLLWCNFIYLFIYSNYLFIRIIVLVISFSAYVVNLFYFLVKCFSVSTLNLVAFFIFCTVRTNFSCSVPTLPASNTAKYRQCVCDWIC